MKIRKVSKMFMPITVRVLKEYIEANHIPDNYVIKHTNEEIIMESPDGKESFYMYEDDD